jgi:hypothetical protein
VGAVGGWLSLVFDVACLRHREIRLGVWVSLKALIAYGIFRVRAVAGITSRAMKAKGHILLCPLLQRCYVGAFLRHLQLLLVLLWGDGGAAEWDADDRVVGVRGGGGYGPVRWLWRVCGLVPVRGDFGA